MMERFEIKYKKVESGCWEWQGAIRNKKLGYGAFTLNGKPVDAHRASYMIYKGDIPDGTLVCHTCDNRKCVNPDHLFLGSYYDNALDALQKGRRVRRVKPKKQVAIHPSNYAYTQGCRCEDCRTVHTAYNKASRQRRKYLCNRD